MDDEVLEWIPRNGSMTRMPSAPWGDENKKKFEAKIQIEWREIGRLEVDARGLDPKVDIRG